MVFLNLGLAVLETTVCLRILSIFNGSLLLCHSSNFVLATDVAPFSAFPRLFRNLFHFPHTWTHVSVSYLVSRRTEHEKPLAAIIIINPKPLPFICHRKYQKYIYIFGRSN